MVDALGALALGALALGALAAFGFFHLRLLSLAPFGFFRLASQDVWLLSDLSD